MLKLLIVEDHQLIRDDLAETFSRWGYEVIKASEGREGIRIAQEQKPQIILLDLGLKDMSGLQVLREAKAANPKTKVIVLTGFGVNSTREKAMSQGADHFLLKPVPLKILKDTVAEVARNFTEDNQ